MRGRLIFINSVTDTGLIFGADSNRYMFHSASWHGNARPQRNLQVEFEAVDDEAVSIRPAAESPDLDSPTFSDDDLPQISDTKLRASRHFDTPPAKAAIKPTGSSDTFRSIVFSDKAKKQKIEKKPSILHFYFSSKGRVSLGEYWLKFMVPSVIVYAAMYFFSPGTGPLATYAASIKASNQMPQIPHLDPQAILSIGMPVLIGSLIAFILSSWISWVVQVKRLHDRGKSAWWMLFFYFVPVAGWAWGFVQTSCLSGQLGPNRFGNDPVFGRD